jgi:hypothetical protein
MRNAFENRYWTGLFGEYYVLTELAKRKVSAQRLNDKLSGCDLITEDNLLIEVKTSQAHTTKGDGEHSKSRGWQFNSIRKETLKKPDVLVLVALNDENEFEIEHIWIVPTEDLIGSSKYGYKNNFLIKDTSWQKVNSNRPDLVSEKWVEGYEDNWEVLSKLSYI